MTPAIINTAGEPEPEARSRRANGLEALGLMCVILATLWPFCFAFGVLGHSAFIRRAASWPLVLVAVWVLGVSPWWHGDTAESLGLGNPRRLWRTLRAAPRARRWRLLAVMATVFAGLNFITLTQWPLVRAFLKLPRSAAAWPTAEILLLGVVLSAFIVTCLIRYDNFGSAFRAALAVSAALLIYAGAAAVLQRGWAAFERFEPGRAVLDVLAYAFWGYLQQLLFTAYFGTRLRKAFAPSPHPPVPPERRTHLVLRGALGAAATLAPAVWLTVRGLYGPAAAPPGLLAWSMVFALPVGAVWMWFFCLDRRRLLVASLAGLFFGLIHIPSYGLVLVTAGLGTILAWLFMEDRTRNLSALGFIHGFLGSTFGKLFNGDAAGALRVNFRVGPWNMDAPSALALIGPLLCLAAFLALAAWCWRRLPAASCSVG